MEPTPPKPASDSSEAATTHTLVFRLRLRRTVPTTSRKRLGSPHGIETPVCTLASVLNRKEHAVKRRARELGLIHPGRSSQQCIANFEAVCAKSLAEIAREYRDHCLPRKALAHGIGIETKTLREALGRELWDSWSFMKIGRLDANKTRQKAA